jgi:aspartate/methionine/tyrosine aminotransferase
VTPWTFQVGDDGWRLDLGFLEQNITSRTKLLVVNFPHNPTGYLPTRAEWDAIVSLARRHDLYLFCDEMYRLLEYEPARRLSPVCDLYEKGLSLFGLSKTFSLPGLRIGWLATQNREIVDKCVLLKDYTTICSSAPSEILGLIALRARETIVERNLGILRRNLGVADRFFAAYADTFDWPRPQAGSIAFPRLKGKTSAEQFCREALGQGVMIVPGSIFDFSGNHFRLGLGRENFPQAIEQIRPLVDALRGD